MNIFGSQLKNLKEDLIDIILYKWNFPGRIINFNVLTIIGEP